MAIRILLADDHKIMREGLRALLEKDEDFEVVAEASNGREALELTRTLKPNIVIMDIEMPDLNGIQATKRINDEFPGVKIIALTVHADKNYLTGMIEAGTSGYLLKDCAAQELVRAVHAVAEGKGYVSPEIAPLLIQHCHELTRPNRGESIRTELTSKEKEVLQLLAEGVGTKEIAARLEQSTKTVERVRAQIMEKLGLFSIAELTKYAIREGITSLD